MYSRREQFAAGSRAHSGCAGAARTRHIASQCDSAEAAATSAKRSKFMLRCFRIQIPFRTKTDTAVARKAKAKKHAWETRTEAALRLLFLEQDAQHVGPRLVPAFCLHEFILDFLRQHYA